MNIVEVANLDYTYPDGTEVFKNISFHLKDNDSLALVGPNGAGKTTLLLALCGFLPGNGTVNIFGAPFNKRNANNLRKKISFVFQNPDDQLFMPTVYEDIAYGLDQLGFSKQEIPKLVNESLGSVGLIGFEKRHSHHLSLGQKKMVCLAAALARNSKLMLFDEPTNELDPGGRRDFIKLIKEIKMPKIIASHDLNFVFETCQKTIIINKKSVISYGETKEILSDKNLMETNRLEVPSILL